MRRDEWTRDRALDALESDQSSVARLTVVARSTDLQDLIAIWPQVRIKRTRAPARRQPLSSAIGDLAEWLWDGQVVETQHLRRLVGPTFPLAATLEQARCLGLVLPDRRVWRLAAALVAGQGLALANAALANAPRPGPARR